MGRTERGDRRMKTIVETYDLTGKALPTISTPHDCVIKEIAMAESWLVLSFEENIARHESVQYSHPNARMMQMRIHLLDEEFSLLAYERRRYENVYVERKPKKLFELARREEELVYLRHLVGYGEMQIELFQSAGGILVDLCADRVEMEWFE